MSFDTAEIDEWNQLIEDRLNSSYHRGLVIGVRLAGALTVLGGGYILQDIAKDATRRKNTKNRIIFFMSACDVINQIVNSIIGPAMVPKGIGVPGAVGNQASCNIQGFSAYLSGGASGLYNVSLAICYLLMVRHEYTDDRLRRLEPWFLYPPVLIFLLLAVAGLPFQIYNFNGNLTCFLDPAPVSCDTPDSPMECTRGSLYYIWNYVNALLVVISAFMIIFCMRRMYTAVLQQESSNDRFRFNAGSRNSNTGRSSATSQRRSGANASRQLSNTMRSQGLWYSGAFLFTFFPLMLYNILGLDFIHWIMLFAFHLIGFTNFIIYIRPRYVNFRRSHPTVGMASSIWYTLARTRPPRGASRRSSQQSRRFSMRSSFVPLVSRARGFLGSLVSRSERNIETESGSPKEVSSAGINEAGKDETHIGDEESSPILDDKQAEKVTKNSGEESSSILGCDSNDNSNQSFNDSDRKEDIPLEEFLGENEDSSQRGNENEKGAGDA